MTPLSIEGAIMKDQLAYSVVNYVENIPNMSAYEMGYDLGFGSEKLLETAVLTRGVGFGANVAKYGFGNAMWKSSAFGSRSYLFGRYHSRYVPYGRRGVFNSGSFRTGWSNHGNRHVFRSAFGTKGTNNKIDWFYGN